MELEMNQAIPEPQPEIPVQKPKKSKIKWIIGIVLAIAIAATAAYFIYNAITNNYKTPVKVMEKIANSDKIDMDDVMEDLYNGFAKKELKDYLKYAKKSSQIQSIFDYYEASINQGIESNKEKYGDNYKITMKIEEKEKLDKDELEDIQDQLNEGAKKMLDSIDAETDEESSANSAGMSLSDYQKLKKAAKALYKKYKNAKITAGYDLTVVQTTKGSKLDDPIEKESIVTVYKIDGRWVPATAFSFISLG